MTRAQTLAAVFLSASLPLAAGLHAAPPASPTPRARPSPSSSPRVYTNEHLPNQPPPTGSSTGEPATATGPAPSAASPTQPTRPTTVAPPNSAQARRRARRFPPKLDGTAVILDEATGKKTPVNPKGAPPSAPPDAAGANRGAAEEPAAPEAAPAEAPNQPPAPSESSVGSPEVGGATQVQWRARAEGARGGARAARERLDRATAERDAATQKALFSTDTYEILALKETQRQAEERLATAQEALKASEEALVAFEEEARRASVPPGWIAERDPVE